jgi:hypothetical protein
VRFGDVSFGVIVTGTGSPTSCTLTWQAVGQGGVAGASPRASVLGGCMVIGQTTPVTAITQDNASGLAWTFTGASSAVFVYYCPQP